MTSIDLSQIDPEALKGASRRDLIQLAKKLNQLKSKAGQVGPQTDDELHAFIKDKWGIHVPRVAVDIDRGHCAPFDMIADIYFERITAGLAVGGRESGKTFNVAIVHALNARFKPGYEGISAGAVSEQSKRAYAALKKLNRTWGGSGAETKETDVESTLQSETVYTNGSIVSILGGTVAQLNGPHSNLLHRDEVELFRRDAFDEANNITRTGVTNDGRPIKAIDILTSSLKYAKGLLQEILERVDTAIKEGNEPPYKVYKWGVAETIAPVANCRHDPKNADLPEEDLCPCDRHVNGVWGDGSPRTLASVCNGRFARSDGYRPLIPDILNKFQQNSRGVWEAQQECIRPAAEGLILENFTRDRHGIRNYIPDPENGLIFLSADFGGTNAHAANWYQLTNRMVACQNHDGGFFVIPANSLVAFDEVYVTEVGNVDFGEMVKASEAAWKEALPYFTVAERYADIAAKAARLDWRSIGLPTVWRITREIEEHISKCVVLVDNFRFYVDVDRCPMFVEEAEAWQRDPATGKQRDVFNHCFVAGTLVATDRGEIPIEDVAVGDRVMTRSGFKRVTASGVSGFTEDLIRLCVDGRVLECTPDHLIYSPSTGWTQAGHMTAGSDVLVASQRSSSAVSSSGNMRQGATTACCSMGRGTTCTAKCGSTTTGRSLRGTKSTICSTMTSTPSTRSGSLSSRLKSIVGSTLGATIATPKSISKQRAQALLSGSSHCAARTGTQRSSSGTGATSVESVERISVPWAPVYDLTVEDAHEFFAEGVLVHNCMSNFRYAVANIDRREKIYNMRGSNDVAAASAKSKDRDHKLDIHQVPATGPASRDLREMPDTIPMHQGASAYDVRIW